MKTKWTTSKYVTLSLLIAIMLIFQFTNLGFIKVGVISITFMCIPIIIGTLSLGLLPGLLLGDVFGLLSFYNALVAPDALFAMIISQHGLAILTPIIFIPRLLIPTLTFLMRKALSGANEKVAIGVCALTGSLTNTVFFLGMLWIFWGQQLADYFSVASPGLVMAPIATIVLTNGLPEAAAAVLICVPVMYALKRAMPKMFAPQTNTH